MKTLILNGSPRKNGDTAALIGKITEKLTGECKIIDAYTCAVSPCVDCRYCWEHSGCAINDEMQRVYDYIRECDNIIIASPVYFSELTGKLLDLGSRLQTFYCAAAFRKETPIVRPKKGAVILVGGGDGHMDRAYGTACVLLRQMNCRLIHPPVCSRNTNTLPAAEDRNAILGTESIVRFFEDPGGAYREGNLKMRTKHVIVLPYDEIWERDFLKIRDEIRDALGQTALAIEHVGSTSVRGLSAKPIIDIDVVIEDSSALDSAIASLERIGYRHEGDLGIPGREAFKYDGKDHLRKHHLYVCPKDSAELKRHIAFRDYLRCHPEAVREYSRVKEEGARLWPYDIEKYIEHKTPFIERIYAEIGIRDM